MPVPQPAYDFWREMLAGHVEVGYLLVMVVVLGWYDVGAAMALAFWPDEDVYLVPGVESSGSAPLTWGVPPPTVADASIPGPGRPATWDLPPVPETVPDAGDQQEVASAPSPSPSRSQVPVTGPPP